MIIVFNVVSSNDNVYLVAYTLVFVFFLFCVRKEKTSGNAI